MLHNQCIYFPVMCAYVYTYSARYVNDYDRMKSDSLGFYKHNMDFWNLLNDNVYFHYPYLLASAFYCCSYDMDKKYNVSREKGTMFFGDSGGFQLAMEKELNARWNRESHLKWAEKYATITALLDMPAYSPAPFDDCVQFTVESAKYIAENRDTENKDLSVLNILSGKKPEAIDRWFSSGISNYEFEGWGHGGTGNSIASAIYGIAYLMYKGIYSPSMRKPMYHHIFGRGSTQFFIYASLIQRILNEMDIPVIISFDSSTAASLMGQNEYIVDINFNNIKTLAFRRKDIATNERVKMFGKYGFSCDCPVCSSIQDISLIADDKLYTVFYIFNWLHNVYQQIRYKNMVDTCIRFASNDSLKMTFGATVFNTYMKIKEIFQKPSLLIEDRQMALFNEIDDMNGITMKKHNRTIDLQEFL